MEAYGLSPDQLIAKAFRVVQSCRPGFKPNSKADWLTAIKRIYKEKGIAGLRRLQKNYPHLYKKAVWIFGGIDKSYRFLGLDPEEIRLHSPYEDERYYIGIYRGCDGKDCRSTRATS